MYTVTQKNDLTFSRTSGTGTQVMISAVELYGLAPTADGATYINIIFIRGH